MTVTYSSAGGFLVGRRAYHARSTSYQVDEAGSSYYTTNTWIAVDTGTFARTHLSQPGSRFYFIDPSQVGTALTIDQAAKIYFWDGTNITDDAGSTTDSNGIAYGTDPRNPNPLATIKAFKRWVYCGPHNNSADIGAAQYVGRANSVTYARDTGAFADGWFIKRGTTFSFADDYNSYCVDKGIGLITQAGLMTPKGASTSSRMYVGAYGSTSASRPKIIDFMTSATAQNVAQPDHVIYQDLHFCALDHSYSNYTAGLFGLSWIHVGTDPTDVIVEGCWIQGFDVNVRIGAHASNADSAFRGKITFRRCQITDAWGASGASQGVSHYTGPVDGTPTGGLALHQCILVRNGFKVDPTIQASFLPTTNTGNWVFNVLTRNIYISGRCDPAVQSIKECVSMAGGSGDTFRSGGIINNNFFYQGYVLFGGNGGQGAVSGGSLQNNVLQRYIFTTGGSTAHPGWGFHMGGGVYSVTASGNIFSSIQMNAADSSGIGYGFKLEAAFLDNTPGFTEQFTSVGQTGVESCTVSGNILDCDYAPPSATQYYDGAADPGKQLGIPITGTRHSNGQTLTANVLATAGGTPTYAWKYRVPGTGQYPATAVDLATSTSTYVQDATTSAFNAIVECYVTGLTWATTLGLVSNTVTANIIVEPSSHEKRYTKEASSAQTPSGTEGVGNDAPGVTTSGNFVYTSLAAAASAKGWSDHTRTLKTYMQSIGQTVTSDDGLSEYYNLAIAMQRGNWDSRLDGLRIVNYFKAGRNQISAS